MSDVMDLLFVQTPALLWKSPSQYVGWYKLQPRVLSGGSPTLDPPNPTLSVFAKECTVAQELSVCLAGFARGKNAHKTSLGVLRKN